MRDLGKARLLAVYVYVERAVHAVEVKVHAALGLRLREVEGAHVHAHGIVVRHEGRVQRYGIGDVRIVRHVEAVHLPVAGHVHGVPVVFGGIVVQRQQILGAVALFEVQKAPRAVQGLVKRVKIAHSGARAFFVGIGDEGGAGRFAVYVQYFRILPGASKHKRYLT